jgi:hypothetical protein
VKALPNRLEELCLALLLFRFQATPEIAGTLTPHVLTSVLGSYESRIPT